MNLSLNFLASTSLEEDSESGTDQVSSDFA